MIESAIHFVETDYGKVIGWLIFILVIMGIDIATGFIQAVYNKDVVSHAMSNGLLKKGAILLLLLAVIPLTILLPQVVTVPIIVSIYLVESVNELVSILENLRRMNIDIGFLNPLMDILRNAKGENTNDKH